MPNSEEFGIEHVEGNFSFHVFEACTVDMLIDLKHVGGSLSILGSWYWGSIYNLDGLSNLNHIGGSISIRECHINNLDVFLFLMQVNGDLSLYLNEYLANIDGLSNITHIYGSLIIENWYNSNFLTLDSFENLNQVDGDLQIRWNHYLTDFCGLENLIVNGGLAGSYTVSNNAYNPSIQDIIDGNCSQ